MTEVMGDGSGSDPTIQRGVLHELIVRNLTMVTAESPSQVT